MTPYERTGWRDWWPSAHHRQLPKTFPRTDVDCVWSSWGRPVALVEEKHVAAKWRPTDYGITTMNELAIGYRSHTHRNGLPAFVVRYDPARLRFTVTALNSEGCRYLDDVDGHVADQYPYREMNEAGYITFQARVRNMSEDQVREALQYVQRQPLPLPMKSAANNTTAPYLITYKVEAREQRNA